MQTIGILLLILFIVFISSFITAIILTSYFLKTIEEFLKRYDKQIMNLISWAMNQRR